MRGSRSTSASAQMGYARLSRVVRLWMRGPFLDVDVEGLEHIPLIGRVVIASNHPSMLNTFVPWAILRRNPAVLILSYAFWVPLLGAIFSHLGNIPVHRDLRVGRLVDRGHRLERAAAAKAAVDILKADGAVQIYPEGRIPRRGLLRKDVLQTFRPGVARIAMLTGSPVVPVGIRLGWKVSRLWVQHTVVIRIGPPILSGTTDEQTLLSQVRAAIGDLSGLPYEEGTYGGGGRREGLASTRRHVSDPSDSTDHKPAVDLPGLAAVGESGQGDGTAAATGGTRDREAQTT